MKVWIRTDFANGKSTATVTLVDGTLTARHTASTHLGGFEDAIVTAHGYAERALDAQRRAQDRIESMTAERAVGKQAS